MCIEGDIAHSITGGVKYGCIASSRPVNRRAVALLILCDDPKSDN
jgi:hypothetical protein